MDHASCPTAMPGVLDLADILSLIIDGLDECSFAEQEFVPQPHEAIFHVPAAPGQ